MGNIQPLEHSELQQGQEPRWRLAYMILPIDIELIDELLQLLLLSICALRTISVFCQDTLLYQNCQTQVTLEVNKKQYMPIAMRYTSHSSFNE
jgi:hypothetical protein